MTTRIDTGFFSFTGVADGFHRDYSTWVLDHRPEVSRLEGGRSNQWWASTPELVDRRLYAGDELAASRYLNLSLITAPSSGGHDRGPVAEARSFDGERTYLRGAFEVVKNYASPTVPIEPDAIPFGANRGVFVTVQDHASDATAAALDEALAWYDEVHIPDLLGVRGVVGCWWFEADGREPGPDANPRGRTIRAYWLDEDPVLFHDDLAAKTPGMTMIDLRSAYRTLIVGSYRAIPTPLPVNWMGE